MDNLKFIPNNHLFVTPLAQEIEFLFKPYLVSSPFKALLPEELHASVLFADRSLVNTPLMPAQIYSAFIKGAEIWWDTYSGIKDLIILLDSPDLEKRHNEVLAVSGAHSAYPAYSPHMAISFDIPNSTSRTRWWVNQIIQDFSTKHKGKLIRFSNETLQSSTGNFPTTSQDSEPITLQQPTL